MPNIFEYSNYHTFLFDYYTAKKKESPTFSYKSFALKADFKNKGFIHSVINGTKNLSGNSTLKIAKAMGLTKVETEYFEILVNFNQATDLMEQTYFFEKLNSIKLKDKSSVKIQQTRKDQYEFYSTWYHSAIRSLVDMYPFKNDFAWLADNVYPKITVKQAKTSVELLEKLGLIEKKQSGFYKITNKSISTGNEISHLAALNFHKEAAHLVEYALVNLPSNKRNITGLTLGISEKAYNDICKELAEARKRIVSIVHLDEGSDRTYQLNFHFFPLTKMK